jgi:hypothetical protein
MAIVVVPPREQPSTQKVDCLCEALRDNDPAGIDANTAHATEIGTESMPKLDRPSMVVVNECVVRHNGLRAIDGLDLAPAMEEAHVGGRRDEVVVPAPRDRVNECRWARDHRPDHRRGSRLDVEIALRSQPVVGVRDDARETPRSAVSRRDEGRRVLAGSRPSWMALRSDACSDLRIRPRRRSSSTRSSSVPLASFTTPFLALFKEPRTLHTAANEERDSPHRTNPAASQSTPQSVRPRGDRRDPGRRTVLSRRVPRREQSGCASHAVRARRRRRVHPRVKGESDVACDGRRRRRMPHGDTARRAGPRPAPAFITLPTTAR